MAASVKASLPAEVKASTRLVREGGKVCIIGGGTTGLLAARCCLDDGLLPTIFERTQRVGGVWRLDEAPTRVAYDLLYMNSSGRMMSASDYPLPEPLRDVFLGRQDICDYYDAFVEAKGLRPYLHFGCEVTSVKKVADGGWMVQVSQSGGAAGREEPEHFDAVFVAAGQFHLPMVPDIPGRDNFRGRVLHSSAYRSSKGLAGKQVLVVGIGNSALDIALEAAVEGAQVTILCRSGALIIPVADYFGHPVDQMLNTRIWQAMPPKLRGLIFWQLIKGTNERFTSYGLPKPEAGKAMRTSNLKDSVQFGRFLQAGKISFVEGSIKSFEESTVVLTGSKGRLQADEIILCTGYRKRFPYLEPTIEDPLIRREIDKEEREVACHLNAYKLIMHPKEPTLCVLGWVLSYGNESCVGELQARWAISHWIGRAPLPPKEAIERELQTRLRRGRYPEFVPYVSYMDELAEACQALPDLSWAAFFRNPILFWKLFLGPTVPAQYRLKGPHANVEEAAKMVRSAPVVAHRMAGLFIAPPHSFSATAPRRGPGVPASRL
eukprot:CAMPEP_0206608228 /NCGR_PEP_ID=MMETSP0325_2-20121206/52839_1 /ASSEMBLY_ACC=CAM_ASM_000347 /TAXON_ID=2866 /ORGANISM="Crypthecodinium cohnii, Strain Seligo" /LENGTH=547 /DNA_ID=CAMNT_0054125829 /DNA_START=272 /DNA_END=1915 /DNA_ORIENTATION=+